MTNSELDPLPPLTAAALERFRSKIADRPDIPDDYDPEESERAREQALRKLQQAVGRRYADCTIDNFDTQTANHGVAVTSVRDYIDDIHANVHNGIGVMLFGSTGTGKDHLAMAIMREAIMADVSVMWVNGADFFGEIRDRIASDQSEREFIRRHTGVGILTLSDPVPPAGDVSSPYQLSMLFRVLDRRYRDVLPTIVTINVADRAEAERRLSPNIIRRMADGALAVHCNWPAYRRRIA